MAPGITGQHCLAPNNDECELSHTRKTFSQIRLLRDIRFILTVRHVSSEDILDFVHLGTETLSKMRSAIAETGLLDFFDPV